MAELACSGLVCISALHALLFFFLTLCLSLIRLKLYHFLGCLIRNEHFTCSKVLHSANPALGVCLLSRMKQRALDYRHATHAQCLVEKDQGS